MGGSNQLVGHLDAEGTLGEDALARREVAEALRALCHGLGGSHAPPAELRALAAALRGHGETLGAARPLSDAPAAESSLIPGMSDFPDRSPIAGRANPLAPPASLAIDREASIVAGEVAFGAAFEGAPGIAHGGFVAAVLDEALGMASAFCGRACMTAELTTRYRQHTPVETTLRVEARLDSVDGRKVRTSGELYAGDAVLAEGHGLFIAVDAEGFRRLVAARAERASG